MRHQLNKLRKFPNQKPSLKLIPQSPGVYIFWQEDTAIYVGKAIDLRNRLNSYFLIHLAPKTAKMVREADAISYLTVESELEALLLEAKLVHAAKPRYNFALKDDKHPLYIKITREKYPRVLTSRKIAAGEKIRAFFGPFPSSAAVRGVLKMLRRILPFADHKLGKRACLYSHLGLCSPCPNIIEQTPDPQEKDRLIGLYRKNILRLKRVLTGELKGVRYELEKEMRAYSAKEAFEEAARVRTQIDRLDYITQPTTEVALFLENPNLASDIREQEKQALQRVLTGHLAVPENLKRIECFDVAHLTGSFPTASMVTFVDAEAEKNLYRHFRIRQTRAQDDIASMREIARRRAANLASWGKPDLIIVDGGKAQVNAFKKVFDQLQIPVIGLAKRLETLILPQNDNFILVNLQRGLALNLLQRIRNEAHRFARSYHHKLVHKNLIEIVGNS